MVTKLDDFSYNLFGNILMWKVLVGFSKYNMTLPFQPHFDRHVLSSFGTMVFFNNENNFLARGFNYFH